MAASYKKYLLTVLMVNFAFVYLERSIVAMVLQDMKIDLRLTDTELGFLSGIAFTLFYSVMGVPIARWADRGNRVTIISITTALCSFMGALCGVAGNFLQLLLIRIGVAVGEAGCIPPAHSLIAEYFTRAERPRAVGIYMLGGWLSIVIGYFLAGWLNEFYGWRATFIMLGLPGLGLAILAWFTLREPRSGMPTAKAGTKRVFTSLSPETAAVSPDVPSLKKVCATLWANKTFRHLLFSFSILFFFVQGIWQWLPTYFVRSFGLQTGELGTWLAVSGGLTGVLGTFVGGQLASRIAAHNERLQMNAMAVACSACGVTSACVYFSPNYFQAFAILGLTTLVGATINGPLFATVQTVVPQRMRAISIAIIYLFGNLIGMGLGPLAAGVLSDALRAWVGEESLRFALLALCPGYVWASWHLWRGSRTVFLDLETAQSAERRVVQEASSSYDDRNSSVNFERGVNSVAVR